MRNALAFALLAGTALSGAAQAQQSIPRPDDVVIMRRIIADPDRTYVSPASFQKVPIEAQPRPTTFPLPSSSVQIDTTREVRCRNARGEEAPAEKCETAPTPPSIGVISIPAKASQPLRTISISRPALVSRAPSLENVDQLCSSRITVDGETWRLTCDDDEIAGDYMRIPRYATPLDQGPLTDAALAFNTTSSARCVDLATGAEVSSCPQTAKAAQGLGTVRIPVRSEAALHVIVIDPQDLLAQAPTLDPQGLRNLCTSGDVRIDGALWKVRCDPEALRVHYTRKATKAYIQNPRLARPSTGATPYQDNVSFSTNGGGVICIDTDTAQPAADQSSCDHLPPTPGVGTITVPATYATGYRTLVFNPADVLARAPDVTNMAEQCLQSKAFSVTGAGDEYWSIRCDASLVSGRYTKIAKLARAASSYYAYERSNRTKFIQTSLGETDFRDSLDVLTMIGTICRDTQDNVEVSASYCSNLPNPPSIGTFPQTATFSPTFRLALIDPTGISAIAPEASTDELCAGQAFNFELQGYYGRETWKTTCNPAEIVNHYKRVSTKGTIAGKSGPTGSSSGFQNVQGAIYTDTMDFSTTAGGVVCMDTNTGQPVTADKAGKCDYLANQEGYGTYSVPAKYSIDQRMVYFSRADIVAKSPNLTNVDTMCGQDVSVRVYSNGTSTQTWRTTCNAEDIRPHYKVVATDATWSSPNREYELNINETTITPAKTMPITLVATDAGKRCIDTDNGETVANGMTGACRNLAVEAGTSQTLTATYSLEYRMVAVNRAEIAQKMPLADANALCAKSVTVRYQNSGFQTSGSFQVTCDADDVRLHHAKVAASFSTATTEVDFGGGSGSRYKQPVDSPLWLSAATTTCIDTDTDKPAADPAKCQYLVTSGITYSSPSGSYRVAQVSARWSPLYKTVYVAPSALAAVSKYASTPEAQFYSRTATAYSGTTETGWKISPDPESVREHHEYRLNTFQSGTVRTNGIDGRLLDECFDTDNQNVVSWSFCANARPSGSARDVFMPAVRDATAGTFVVDVSEIRAIVPAYNWDNYCKPTQISYNGRGYTRTCK